MIGMIAAGYVQASGGGGYDTDAQAFITAAGITDNTQKTAINTLVLDLKSNSLWTKMLAVYPLVGGTATSHKWNLKDPRDLDAAFRLTYTAGTQTHNSNGMQGDGVGYVSTNISPASHLSINDMHVSCYVSNLNSQTALAVDICSYRIPTNVYLGLYKNGTSVFSHLPGNMSNGRLSAAPSSHLGFFCSTRTSSTSHKIYRNGVSIASASTAPTNILEVDPIYLLGLPYGYRSTKVYPSFTAGLGLSDTDASNLYTIMQAFQTTLGRQV